MAQSNNNSNNLVVPRANAALEQLKYEVKNLVSPFHKTDTKVT